jgi:hypothetical protein
MSYQNAHPRSCAGGVFPSGIPSGQGGGTVRSVVISYSDRTLSGGVFGLECFKTPQ